MQLRRTPQLRTRRRSNMRSIALVLQNAIRLIGLASIILGFLFWTRNYLSLIPLHMYMGVALVVLLWLLAATAAAAKVSSGLVARSVLWGVVVLFFGMTMGRLLPGRAHEIVRVLHFLIGLGAIGLAESLAVRIKRQVAVPA